LNKDKSPADSNVKENIDSRSHNDFVTPSLLLFLDIILISIGSWAYWLILSKLTTPSEIGIAITVYSLAILITTITQLGLEYPLLKKSSISGSRIIGTCLVIELAITIFSIPFVFFILNTYYDDSINRFAWICIGLLILSSLAFVARFGLLGISDSKTVLIIDSIGLGIKLSTGLLLVYMSFGALGMLLAYLFDFLFVSCISLFIAKKLFSFRFGNIKNFVETIKDALINTPAKYSKVIIVNLSIVLLPLLNISSSKIGIFYIALTISVFVTSFALSMAYMVIPASSSVRRDLSSESLRFSLSLISPIVVLLLVAPRSVLSLVGPEYESGQNLLFVLAMTIIPSSITVNMISKLNTLGKSKLLILTGMVQIVTFFIFFLILVPIYETLGAAISIFVVYVISSILLIIVTDRRSLRYIMFACVSVLAGFISGYLINIIIGYEQQFLVLISSITVSIGIILASKNMTIIDLKFLLKVILQRR